MDALPVRIEGYDISNLGASHTVASMVVFEGGAPRKSDYRRFKIRKLEGRQDDFAAMQEVLSPADGALGRAARPLAARSRARPQLRLAAGADRDRRRQGPALERRGRARRSSWRPASWWSAWRSDWRRYICPAARSRSCCRATHARCSCCSGSATRRTASRASITASAARSRCSGRSSTSCRASGRRASARSCVTSARPERFLGATREELEAVPGLPGKVARQIHEQLNKTGAKSFGSAAQRRASETHRPLRGRTASRCGAAAPRSRRRR